jgi:hypothetical protein
MTHPPKILVATDAHVFRVDPLSGAMTRGRGLEGRFPSALAWDPWDTGRAWCGTTEDGIYRSPDGGASWAPSGLPGGRVTSLSASPAQPHLLWAGTEPSAVWRSGDGGDTWEEMEGLRDLPSSSEWSFPPRPETHHVRWIACHPSDPQRLWVAVEAGALVATRDGGESWEDRREGGPRDTHELAIHSSRPELLRVAAGDGYFESPDGGRSWTRAMEGLDVTYLRSVAVDPGDPGRVLVTASSRPRTAYVAGHSDGRVYSRLEAGVWTRVREGWPEPPDTIAPLVRPGTREGELWAADDRGIHRSRDGGESWLLVAAFETRPHNLRGFALV